MEIINTTLDKVGILQYLIAEKINDINDINDNIH